MIKISCMLLLYRARCVHRPLLRISPLGFPSCLSPTLVAQLQIFGILNIQWLMAMAQWHTGDHLLQVWVVHTQWPNATWSQTAHQFVVSDPSVSSATTKVGRKLCRLKAPIRLLSWSIRKIMVIVQLQALFENLPTSVFAWECHGAIPFFFFAAHLLLDQETELFHI